MKIKYLIPEFYQDYFPNKIYNLDINESKATCDQCIQSPAKYKNDLKCCTFWPFIPNYIVGAILSDQSDRYKEKKEYIINAISNKKWNLPLGLIPSPIYQVNHKKTKSRTFGKSEKYLCPYYDKTHNQCGVWKFRGSVCTSFYCESSYKNSGQKFWKAFESYFHYLEMALSEEVIVYKDYSPRDMSFQLEFINIKKTAPNFDPSEAIPDILYKKIWKHNMSNEIQFYKDSYELFIQFEKQQKKDIIGELGKFLQAELEDSAHKLGAHK